MSGIKGQKWSVEKRRPEMVKMNIRVDKRIEERIILKSGLTGMTKSSILSKLVHKAFEQGLLREI